MTRRKLIWHIGVADSPRPLIPANLDAHRESLASVGVSVAASAAESLLATHELLRTHQQAGLKRREVEGQWARICDRVWAHPEVSLISTPDLCVADKDQIRLALDALIGLEVHLVLTLDTFSQQLYGGWLSELRAGQGTGWNKYVARVLAPQPEHAQGERFWAGHDAPALLGRWGWTLHAERLHILAQASVEGQWHELLDLAGVADLRPEPVLAAYADPAGAAVLRRVNRELDVPLGASTLSLLSSAAREEVAMPVADTGVLLPVVGEWTRTLTTAGHDLRGDLELLVEKGQEQGAARAPQVTLPGPRTQLAVAVDVLADALAENSRLRAVVAKLEADQERHKRKRRKLKRRLARLVATGN